MVHSDPGPVVPTRCLYPADTCPKDISSLRGRGPIIQLSDQHNHKRPKRARVYSSGTHGPAERSFIPTDPTCCGRPTTITVLCPGKTRRTAQEADARKGTPLLTSHTVCSIPALYTTGPADKQFLLCARILRVEESPTFSFEFVYTWSDTSLYTTSAPTSICSNKLSDGDSPPSRGARNTHLPVCAGLP